MQFGEFFFDGDKRKIYEAPTVGFQFTVDGDGYRIYTPIDEPTAPQSLIYTTYEVWSRSVDFIAVNSWALLPFDLSGGAYRYTDQFDEDKFSLIDLRLINGWAYVPCNYPHFTYIRGNLFPNADTNIDFDTSRITIQGVSPRIFFSDAGERSAEDPEIARQNTEALQYASFGGQVSLKESSEYSGVVYPVGNRQYPVNNGVDAVTIATTKGFPQIGVTNNYTFGLGHNISGLIIQGNSHVTSKITVDADAICSETIFRDVDLTGVLDGESELSNCVVRDLVYFNGHIHGGSLAGTIVLGGSKPAKISNATMLDFSLPVVIDCGGGGQDLILDGYTGFITITNLTGAAMLGIENTGGTVIIDASCSAGTIYVSGACDVEDNSTGTVVDTTGLISHAHQIDDVPQAVWNFTI